MDREFSVILSDEEVALILDNIPAATGMHKSRAFVEGYLMGVLQGIARKNKEKLVSTES